MHAPRRPLDSLTVPFLVMSLAARLAGAAGIPEQPSLLDPPGPPLPGTAPLTTPGDLASNLVAGVDRFLDRHLADSVTARQAGWRPEVASPAAYAESLAAHRVRLAEILGAVEARPVPRGFELLGSTVEPAVVASSGRTRVVAVRWAAFGDVHGEGLLLTPANEEPIADVVAVPDADLTPEQWIGIEPGAARESQVPRRLAEAGCRVLVPCLVDRKAGEPKVDWDAQRGRNLSNREFVHRPAFEMGRTLAGYEVLKILAAVDVLRAEAPGRELGVIGWGEGGRLALYAAALDSRIGAAAVSGYFQARERVWEEPLDRNVFGLLERFGDAELAALIAPRRLVIEAARGPEREFPSDGGAPGRLATPALDDVRREVDRARRLTARLNPAPRLDFVRSGEGGDGAPGTAEALGAFLDGLRPGAVLPPDREPRWEVRGAPGGGRRAARQRHELDRHTQALLADSGRVRARFLGDLDVANPEAFAASQERYRRFFADSVIGRFEEGLAEPGARSRQVYDEPRWRGYEVTLEVFPDVMAYGLLLLPKDLGPGERRPVVVCQHGLEGRPQHTIGREGFEAYSAFSARLAERGFVVFAPQNLYLFRDRFRVLQRKANPLGKTLFSIITPQHQQIVNWLQTQPFVDPARIAFYGLSYGGKTAMRVPALVTDYCLSICSADFNDWVWKNASTRSPYSYVWTGEYEIFEWNLGHTFNYAEMAALIAPRPFMVERGHFDGVAPDETVAYEFAKVRHFYAARLKRPAADCQIEWFVGPHQIHGVGTYEFLHRHLDWPAAR